jgi:hypothetical protein
MTHHCADSPIRPFLFDAAVVRTGDAELPGHYCPQAQVWTMEGQPIVQGGLAGHEMLTKTSAQIESDDNDPTFLEMQTKTKAQMERDDDSFELKSQR